MTFKKSLKIAAVIMLISGIGALSLWLTPSSVKRDFELTWSGVRRISLGSWVALERSECQARRECTCIILVHGLGDQAKTYSALLQLPKSELHGLRLIAPHLPGMGESPPPAKPEDYRVRTLALDLVNAIQSQPECSRALYVGNSFGGWVTAWAALLHPEKVSKLLLVGSGGMTIPVLSGHLLSRPTRQTLEEFQRRAYYSPRALTEAEWEQALKRASETPSQEILAAQRTEDELRPYLGGLQVPTHVFRGSADQIVPERVAREMASRIPGAVYYEAPQCGHLPQKECPEALWRAIQNLLKSGAL